jgi:hypothetical protein
MARLANVAGLDAHIRAISEKDFYCVECCFNCQLEDCFEKVFLFGIASYLKFQKFKVSNEVQSNKINRGASTAVSVSHFLLLMLDKIELCKNFFIA